MIFPLPVCLPSLNNFYLSFRAHDEHHLLQEALQSLIVSIKL